MITWLDEYARFSAQCDIAVHQMGWEYVEGIRPKHNIDHAAMVNVAFGRLLRDPEYSPAMAKIMKKPPGRFMTSVCGYAEPFLMQAAGAEMDHVPLALQVDPKLAEGLFGLTQELDPRLLKEAIRDHGTIYVDIPRGVFPMGPRKSLAGIFVTSSGDGIALDPTTGEPVDVSEYKDRIVALTVVRVEGEPVWSHELYNFFLDGSEAVTFVTAGVAVEGQDQIRRRLAHLTTGAVLYYRNGEPADFKDVPRVNQREFDQRYVEDRQWKVQEQKELTLFRITKLYPPGSGTIVLRREGGPSGNRQIGVRYEVDDYRSHRWCKDPKGEWVLKPCKVKGSVRGPDDAPWSPTTKQKLYRLMPGTQKEAN